MDDLISLLIFAAMAAIIGVAISEAADRRAELIKTCGVCECREGNYNMGKNPLALTIETE